MAEATFNEAHDGLVDLSEQGLVDYLCTAVEEEDALYVWIWLRRLRERGAENAVTSLHSWKQRSALSFGANTPQTPLRLFILQTLLLSLEVEEAVSTAVKGVGALSWVEEEARRIEPKREAEAPEAAAFLALGTEHEAADWVDENLPPLDKDPDKLTGYKPLPPRRPIPCSKSSDRPSEAPVTVEDEATAQSQPLPPRPRSPPFLLLSSYPEQSARPSSGMARSLSDQPSSHRPFSPSIETKPALPEPTLPRRFSPSFLPGFGPSSSSSMHQTGSTSLHAPPRSPLLPPPGWSPPPEYESADSPDLPPFKRPRASPSSIAADLLSRPPQLIKPHASLPARPTFSTPLPPVFPPPPPLSYPSSSLIRQEKILFPREHPITLQISPLPSTETIETLTSLITSSCPSLPLSTTTPSDIRFTPLPPTSSFSAAGTGGAGAAEKSEEPLRRAIFTLPNRSAADAVISALSSRPYPSTATAPATLNPSLTLTVQRAAPLVPLNEAWRFPLVRVEGLSGSAKKNFAGLLRGAGVGAAAVELDRAEDGGRARLAGGRFRVASPEAAERAVGVLNGMRVEGWELKARWEMDEGVRWEVVDGQRAG